MSRGILHRCWDIITLGKLKWYLSLVLVTLFYIPTFIEGNTDSAILRFLDLPRIVPPPDVPADILSTRDFLIIGEPPLVPTLNHYWVSSDAFLPLLWIILGLVSIGFLGAELRVAGGIDKVETIEREEPGIWVIVGVGACLIVVVLVWHLFIFEFVAPYLPIKLQ